MEIIITPHALLTVHSEFIYLKEFATERAAHKFKNGFVEKVDSILPNHLAYPECRFLPTKNNTYRNIIWGNYLIIYKVLKKEILVLGVFHSKQNPAKLKAYRKVRSKISPQAVSDK